MEVRRNEQADRLAVTATVSSSRVIDMLNILNTIRETGQVEDSGGYSTSMSRLPSMSRPQKVQSKMWCC
uniref:Uncharacterized protein n=1 Tax=Arion vulgaris TaxID=1028688 RepID=A0A0B7A8K0_9EUPU